ncbi:LPS export ABC transporter permease LptF [Thiomicrorhabdus sp. 6S3-12]|uniref:LPS export ABC transporter permease LptF n=1 Tax=Thiomicrorhabdus sp. 6S3-12 TaxID=2819681 RepID=UPI001AACF0D6|nr:LPS export ABC transporter permease LptF [Thiomicrorhabdus sp. 6S3-12]MBO1923035.1 LPS export ABC transporter permease LptF [Thiomicrorhabdus sp. 6S3-12]
MRIIDKMLLKELLWSFSAVLIVLLLITFGAEATKLLAIAMEGKLPVAVVGQVLLLKLPTVLELILPLATMIGVMLTFGRLYQDQEMVVLNSCGVAPSYFRRLLLWFLLPLTLLGVSITHYFSPYALSQERVLLDKQEVVSPVAALVPGKFNSLPGNRGVFYAKAIAADGALEDVWVKFLDKQNDLILMAPKGQFITHNDQVILRLQQGWRYQNLNLALGVEPTEDRAEQTFEVQYFESFEGVLPELTGSRRDPEKEELSTWTLLDSENPKEQAILQWRIAAPLGILVLGMLGLQLSRTGPRQGRFSKVFIAIVFFILFNQLLIAGRNAIEDGYWPATIGLWPIPLLFLFFSLGVFGWLKHRMAPAFSKSAAPADQRSVHKGER